ncbi:MAG: class I SAM-dependent methyltransferase [Cyanobacteria bacterium J06648_10]
MNEDRLDTCYVPDNHSRQMTSNTLTGHLLKEKDINTVMDLGCGPGDSIDFFRAIDQFIDWIGLDLEQSPEVNKRKRTDAAFVAFNGIIIPFEDNHFDLIYCNQVFEHVRYPAALLKEVARVLKPNGYFVGATSQLEPYHSYSVWNFTPYGFQLLIEEAGLKLVEVRPSIDALTLIIRRGLRRHKIFSRWWDNESPLNRLIGLVGKLTRQSHKEINQTKLLFCGQFCFLVQK